MPKPSLYTLIWSEMLQHYELFSRGQIELCFREEDEVAFSDWLQKHTSFAFVGKSGCFSVIKEGRSRGTGYWYLYHKQHQRTSKSYLGPSERVTLARLEEQASHLTDLPFPLPSAPEAKGPSSSPLKEVLSSKLTPPRLPVWLVQRSRLLEELYAIYSHPLTLVSASAGSGKTTLLSAWTMAFRKKQASESTKHTIAWLSLDELDNDSLHFWTSAIAALRQSGTGPATLGEKALALLHAPQSPPLSAILVTLLNELMQLDREAVLILDDYHVISDQTIHESLLFLLDHLPDTLHLVLISRTDPELPLARFRMRGQIFEVRSGDLRFTSAEAASFLLEGMRLPLTEEDVTILSQRTEGWIAGLQLAALSLRKQDNLSGWISDFAGNYRYLLDYVEQDILTRLPEQLQDFLLQTSIVTRMNAAICQALTEMPTKIQCQEMLEEVERSNLFVVLLDERRQWYRYHDLFRETLLARLQASQPGLAPLLHLRAARFYEATGDLRAAIVHALASPDHFFAASLMEKAAPTFWLRGEGRTVLNWVLALPEAVLRLALDAALRLIDSVNLSNETLYSGMLTLAEGTFKRLEGLVLSTQQWALSDGEVTWIKQRLRRLRAWIELRVINKERNASRLRSLTQEVAELPPDEDVNWNMIPLSIAFWQTAVYQGDGAVLISQLREAKQQMIEAGDPSMTIRVLSMLARTSTQAGYMYAAHQEALQALALVERMSVRTPWEGHLYASLFIASYAQNRLEEAGDWLQRLKRSLQDWQPMQLQFMGEVYSGRLALAERDLSAAKTALHQLEALMGHGDLAYHNPWVSVLRVQCWLAEGRLAQASEWAEQITFPPDIWDPLRRWELLMLVRVYLSQQKPAQAVATLSHFSQFFDRPGHLYAALEWMALSVIALHRSGEKEQAMRIAARLFEYAGPEDYVRLDLDTGEPLMKGALLTLLKCPSDGNVSVSFARSSVLRLLSTLEHEERRSMQTREASSNPAQMLAHQALIEPLSQQEQRVLKLLVRGQTYPEMAQTLIVSTNTIKTQVSSIYRKLGVNRRAQAIACAQRLHLF